MIALFWCQGNDLGGFGRDDALFGILVQFLSLFVHMGGDFDEDLVQLAAKLRRQTVPELGVGDQHVVQYAVVGFGDELLHFMHLLAVDVRVRILRAVDDTGLQALINLGEAHFARIGAYDLELFLKHCRGLHPELQATGITGHS
ncbi:hypothetical protein D9M68_901210 [compost metagenome]